MEITTLTTRPGADMARLELLLGRLAPTFDAAIRTRKAEATRAGYHSDWDQFAAWCELVGASPLPASVGLVVAYAIDRADVEPDPDSADDKGAPTRLRRIERTADELEGIRAAAREYQAARKRGEEGVPVFAPLTLATIGRHLVAINQAHVDAGHDKPASRAEQPLKNVWAQLEAALGTNPVRQRKAMLIEHARRIVDSLPVQADDRQTRLVALRDRALLLLGYASGLRRSELAALRVEDLSFVDEGVLVKPKHTKTDQAGKNKPRAVRYGTGAKTCPVRALQSWLVAGELRSGRVFRAVRRNGEITDSLTGVSINNAVRRMFENAGLEAMEFGAHSLRAGLMTQGIRNGHSVDQLMPLGGWKHSETARGYYREAKQFEVTGTSVLGL